MGTEDLKKRAVEIEELVVKAQNGDHNAFSKLYDIFIDPIYRYVFYRVRDEDAEDLVETVFLKVWENLKKYKAGKSSFSAWIFRIAHNQVVDYYRLTKDRTIDELDQQIPTHKREHNPIRTTEDAFNQSILKKALSNMKKTYREIIIYKFINELSNKEIAEALNRSEGSIRILQFRALKSLKKELGESGINFNI